MLDNSEFFCFSGNRLDPNARGLWAISVSMAFLQSYTIKILKFLSFFCQNRIKASFESVSFCEDSYNLFNCVFASLIH